MSSSEFHFCRLNRAFYLRKCAAKRLNCPYLTALYRKINTLRWSDPDMACVCSVRNVGALSTVAITAQPFTHTTASHCFYYIFLRVSALDLPSRYFASLRVLRVNAFDFNLRVHAFDFIGIGSQRARRDCRRLKLFAARRSLIYVSRRVSLIRASRRGTRPPPGFGFRERNTTKPGSLRSTRPRSAVLVAAVHEKERL